MAYIDDPNQDNQQNQLPIMGQSSSPINTRPQTPKSSGRFTNISQYISANKPQTQALAQTVGGSIGKQAEAVKTGLAQQQSQFQQQVSPEEQRLAGSSEFAQQAIQSPVEIASDADKLAKFQQLSSGQGAYQNITAPETRELQQKAFNLQTLGGIIGQRGGASEAVRQTINTPTYSQGQRTLDELLLMGNKPVRQQLMGQVQGATQGLGENVSQFSTEAQARLNALKEQAGNVQTLIGERLPQEITTEEKSLRERRTAATQAQQDLTNRLMTGLQQGKLTQADMELLGLQPGTMLYGADPTQYLKSLQPTFAQVATPEEAARYRALGQLSGISPTLIKPEEQIGGIDLTKPSGVEPFQQAIAQAKTGFEQKQAEVAKLDYQTQRMHDAINAFGKNGDISTFQYMQKYEPEKIQKDANDLTNAVLNNYSPLAANNEPNDRIIKDVRRQIAAKVGANLVEIDRTGGEAKDPRIDSYIKSNPQDIQQMVVNSMQDERNNYAQGSNIDMSFAKDLGLPTQTIGTQWTSDTGIGRAYQNALNLLSQKKSVLPKYNPIEVIPNA